MNTSWLKKCAIILLLVMIAIFFRACYSMILANSPQVRLLQGTEFRRIESVHGDKAFVAVNIVGGREMALIDIVTGEKILPVGEIGSLSSIYDNLAAVTVNGEWAIIDITNGEIVFCFGIYDWICSIRSIYSDGMAIVRCISSATSGLIDIASGVELIPLGTYNTIIFNDELGLVNARIFSEGSTLFDFQTGEVIIPLGEFDVIQCIIDDMIVVADTRRFSGLPETRYNFGVFDMESGEMIIPRGEFERIRLVGDGIAFVETHISKLFCENLECENSIDERGRCDERISFFGGREVTCGYLFRLRGLIDIVTGEEIIPLGKYHYIYGVYDGFAVVDMVVNRSVERGLIHIASGETVIPFGSYRDMELYPSGHIALDLGWSRWVIHSLEDVKSVYGWN